MTAIIMRRTPRPAAAAVVKPGAIGIRPLQSRVYAYYPEMP